jgi:hypothetical protein
MIRPSVAFDWLDGGMSDAYTDWVAWHDEYADPWSSLSRRLRAVQREIRRVLPPRVCEPFSVVSVCAGQGDDLIGVLRDYEHRDRIRARMVELDPRNVASMGANAQAAGVEVEIVQGDAADPSLYAGMLPADLVLLCGVLGNITDDDARFTIASLPEFCKSGASVIWTRGRRGEDRIPQIRRWFREAEFSEIAFVAPPDAVFSVGACRFEGAPRSLRAKRLFTFVR